MNCCSIPAITILAATGGVSHDDLDHLSRELEIMLSIGFIAVPEAVDVSPIPAARSKANLAPRPLACLLHVLDLCNVTAITVI